MSNKTAQILILPGDHIGPEVVTEALKVLDIVEERTGNRFERDFDLCGGCSLDKHQEAVTETVLEKCQKTDAVFFGSAGGPEWGTVQPNPESGLLRIRERMQVSYRLFLLRLRRADGQGSGSSELMYVDPDLREPPTMQIRLQIHDGSLAHQAQRHQWRGFHARARELRRCLLRQKAGD